MNNKKTFFSIFINVALTTFILSIMSVVDSVFASGLGVNQATALALVTSVFAMVIMLSGGLGVAIQSSIGYFKGKKDRKGEEKAIGNGIIISLIVTGISTIILVFGSGYIFNLITQDQAVLAQIGLYSLPLFLFSGIFMFENVLASILRSIYLIKQGIFAIAVAAILNIPLNWIFINVFGLGIAGIAYGSVLSGLVGVIILIKCMIKHVNVNYKIDIKMMLRMIKISMSNFIGTSFANVQSLILTTIFISSFGAIAVAAYSNGFRLIFLLSSVFIGISSGLLTLVSYYKAQHDIVTIKRIFKKVNAVSVGLALIMIVIFFIIRYPLASIFGNPDLLHPIANVVGILSFFTIAYTLSANVSSTLQALVKVKQDIVLNILRYIILCVGGVLIAVEVFNVTFYGALIVKVISLAIGAIIGLLVVRYILNQYLDKY